MFNISSLAGYFVTQSTIITPTTTPQLLIKADTSRPILYVSNPTTFITYLEVVGFSGSGTFFQFNVPSNTVRQFTWILDGPLPTLGFNVWLSGGPANISFTEVRWLPPQGAT